MTKLKIQSLLVLVGVGALISGCGGNNGGVIVPVAGVVTLDGKPLANVELVFSPIGTENNPNPGPWSNAITKVDGSFELKTRYGKSGAVVAKHAVSFHYPDVDTGEMISLQEELKEATSDAETDPQTISDLEGQLEDLKTKLKGRVILPPSASREIEVPDAGLPDLKIEMTSEN